MAASALLDESVPDPRRCRRRRSRTARLETAGGMEILRADPCRAHRDSRRRGRSLRGGARRHSGPHVSGHLRSSTGLTPLPAGSPLDPYAGRFTWTPAPASSVPTIWCSCGPRGTDPISRKEVRFVLRPKTSGFVGTQVSSTRRDGSRTSVSPSCSRAGPPICRRPQARA